MSKRERICRAHLLLTKTGIGFDFSEVGVSKIAEPIAWEKFESVTFSKPRRIFASHTELQFKLSMQEFPEECAKVLANYAGNFFTEQTGEEQKVIITLRSDGFATAIHRRELIEFIIASVSAEKFIGRQGTTSGGAKETSYTKLWFDSLSLERNRKGDLPPGTLLNTGRYKIENQLGFGGQGVAYLAIDSKTNYLVVLKEFVLPNISTSDEYRELACLSHIRAEGDLLRSLDHPQVIAFIDSFIEDRRAYLVTE